MRRSGGSIACRRIAVDRIPPRRSDSPTCPHPGRDPGFARMSRWEILGVILFGALFALFAFFRVEALDSRAVKGIVAAFLFGAYCAIVLFGTDGRKRSLSLAAQTALGVMLALALAALFQAPPAGFALAAALGLVLGFTADLWVKHVQLP